MDTFEDAPLDATGLHPVAVVGGIAAVLPFLLTIYTSSGGTRIDFVALGGAAVAAVCAIVLLVLLLQNKAARVPSAVAAAVILTLAVVHGVRGYSSDPSTETTTTTTTTTTAYTVRETPRKNAAPKSCKEDPGACEIACDEGNVSACSDLGVVYLNDGNEDRARALFSSACDGDHALGCSNLGAILERSKAPTDRKRARELFKAACLEKIGMACSNYGRALVRGIGGEVDLQGGVEAFDNACKLGERLGCVDQASFLAEGKGVDKADQQEARLLFLKGFPDTKDTQGPFDASATAQERKHFAAQSILDTLVCERGDSRGCNRLAILLWNGRGVPQDKAKARELAGKACDAKNRFGCWNSTYYALLEETTPDALKKAARAFHGHCTKEELKSCDRVVEELYGLKKLPAALLAGRAACEQGAPSACEVVAIMQFAGEATPKDIGGALETMTRACDLGLPSGCKNIAVLHDKGTGTPRDVAKANTLFSQACDMGNGQACRVMGFRYRDGSDGLKKDVAKAKGAFERACKAGEKLACEQLK